MECLCPLSLGCYFFPRRSTTLPSRLIHQVVDVIRQILAVLAFCSGVVYNYLQMVPAFGANCCYPVCGRGAASLAWRGQEALV